MIAFRVWARAEDEDLAIALLWEGGTAGVEVRPADPGEVLLLAYFEDRPGLPEELGRLLARLPGAWVEPAEVAEVDWVSRVREGFRPFRVGGFLVAPPWAQPHASAAWRRLVVEPGRAFGTGTHETTRLCLGALEELARERALGRVLDVGAGTGLLAVAAALLGAGSVTAADIDPEAAASAARHARLNGVRLAVVRGDGGRPFVRGAFDLVLANLTSPLLLERRSEMGALPSPGGALVLSGFLTEDVPAMRAAYEGLGPLEVRSEGEWAAVIVRRGGSA